MGADPDDAQDPSVWSVRTLEPGERFGAGSVLDTMGWDVLVPATGVRLEVRRPLAAELEKDFDAKVRLNLAGPSCP